MRARIVSLVTPLVVGIMALSLGWYAHAAVPLAAQGIVVDGHVTRSEPAAPAAPAYPSGERLTYQGRLLNSDGTPVNMSVNVTFKLYDATSSPIYTATRIITPLNGLFTVSLGDGSDPNLSFGPLSQAVAIGVQIQGESAEMSPRQGLNTIVGHSDTSAGVIGSSDSSIGVRGASNSGMGVYGSSGSDEGVRGFSVSKYGVNGTSTSGIGVNGTSTSGNGVNGTSTSNDGVVGHAFSGTHAGVSAIGADTSGIALRIDVGGLQVTGAGIISNTNNGPVFTIKVVTGTVGNNVTPSVCGGNCVVIDNPLTNNRSSAIVIVTPNFSPAGVASGIYTDHPVSVWYDAGITHNKWEILHPDGSPMLNGAAYNVLVVNP